MPPPFFVYYPARPVGAISITIASGRFFLAGNTFYTRVVVTGQERFVVVPRPAGLVAVKSLPRAVEPVAVGRAAQALLLEMEGHDPMVFAAAAVALTLVALCAGWIPAHRASRVDPMQALRCE